MNKNELRAEIKKRLKSYKDYDFLEKSDRIVNNLMKDSCFLSAKNICCYASFGYEVRTNDILSYVLECDKMLLLPRCNEEENTLSLFEVVDFSQLTKGSFGILEPDSTCKLYTGDVDMFIVPGIAFGKGGERLGRGKGYYDRLLKAHPKSSKCGISFQLQISELIKMSKHDIFMDMVVTENEIYKSHVK